MIKNTKLYFKLCGNHRCEMGEPPFGATVRTQNCIEFCKKKLWTLAKEKII